ncbi:AAA family ATPase [Colwellia sp. 6_MG-2023]|uniref:AAA family ATPase n=1 Tax=Colwellia sp. 6_MG-2023 TaxID=3062676 RepID=UPI0026E39FE4|nr:AAA family ATPase [Colwellia sp. 6_MG-2023]MDO6489476.1 AAA family ATPase [Colwellia sp. 6_MG-2023]
MYRNFFSLSELPFSIAPNPKYLFMSDRHREALTHLSHGLGGVGASDNGGFVLLTGEVGTGKTTVSRCLMDDLPKDTQLAFILNPTLSSQELLATICDQLKIRYRKTGATLKTLTDKISEKLVKNHDANINTILIIDEAQHLEAQVLEQLRLLTNLETNTKKLLQVILIGQPELQQLLKRRDLRQLAQRITARYHLLPLNTQELAAYIKHRLSVADCHRALFDKGAIATIHKLSQGIPRLINLLCHSSLMEAYNSNNAVVNKKIVLKAASHALGDDFEQTPWWQNKNIQIASAASALILVLVAGFWLGQSQNTITTSTDVPVLLQEESSQQLSNNALPKVVESLEEAVEGTTKTVTEKAEPAQDSEVEQIIVSGDVPRKASTQKTVQQNQVEHVIEPQKTTEKEVVITTKTASQPINEPVAKSALKPASKPPALKPTTKAEAEENNYQIEAVDGVSDDLLARFQAAIEETESNTDEDPATALAKKQEQPTNSEIKSLTEMPAWVQEGVPSLRFEQHIYASDGEGWVNVNGRDRYEGDNIANGVIIDKILPQQVILTYRGEKFSLPALTNW